MLQQNATMTMEMWDSGEKPNLDWSHPWSSSPAFVVPWHLFGISPTKPGFSELEILPQPGDIADGTFTLPSMRGPITVSLKQDKGVMSELTVELPASVKAIIGFPLAKTSTATDDQVVDLIVDGSHVVATVRNNFAMAGSVGPGGTHKVTLKGPSLFV